MQDIGRYKVELLSKIDRNQKERITNCFSISKLRLNVDSPEKTNFFFGPLEENAPFLYDIRSVHPLMTFRSIHP